VMIKLNENIAFLRKQKGITQEELANAIHVSNQAVSKWESGKCCPDIELLPDLACFFGVTIDELLLGKCVIVPHPATESNEPLAAEALKIAQDKGRLSPSLLQREFRIGYGKAKRMIDDLLNSGSIVKMPGTNSNIYTLNHSSDLDHRQKIPENESDN